MAIDLYAPCPCGSGKKLKFCCGDLATEIEKVHRMIQGEQPHAALQHVEQLLSKDLQRASLLDLKATIELSLHNFDAARATIDTFLVAHPQNASAHAHAAILTAAVESGTAAIGPLQDALELLDKDMPLRVLEAIGAVGQGLLMQGELIAARSHLLLYAGIAPEGDKRGLELLLRMNTQAGLPLLMREYLMMAECSADVPWQEQYLQAVQQAGRGAWRRAEAIIAKLRDEEGPLPPIVYSLALLRGWLGDTAAFAAGLHEYATLEIPLDHAAEAEALAQLVDPNLKDPQRDTVRVVFPVGDEDALTTALAEDRRVEEYPLDPASQAEDEPDRPRSTHILLDRQPPTSGVDIERSDIPHVLGFLAVFGKRTDREARLELTADRDERLEEVQNLVREVVGDTLGEVTETDVLTTKSVSEEALSWRWRLPNDTPPEHRRQLLQAERRDAILDRWTAAPRGALGGKSPAEAVGDQSLHIALVASALIIEQAAVDPAELPMFAELRERLKLPVPKNFGSAEVDLEHLPMVRAPRLDLSQLTDVQLARMLDRTTMMGADLATLLVARELISREEHDESVDLSVAYRQAILREPNHDEVGKWIEHARSWSRSRGESEAQWVVMTMELAIERGNGTLVQESLNEIRDKYLQEPGVADATYRILYAAGLVAPPEAAGQSPLPPQPMGPPAPASKSTGIWTPGDDSSSARNAGTEDKPAIWTP